MLSADLDKYLNFLKITYAGRVAKDEARLCLETARLLIKDLKPPLTVLTDLSSLDYLDLECLPFIDKLMDLCNSRGISMVVRVIPDPHKDFGLNILTAFHYKRRIRVVTLSTMDEALKLLAGQRSEGSIAHSGLQ